jgi:hypothetical protein
VAKRRHAEDSGAAPLLAYHILFGEECKLLLLFAASAASALTAAAPPTLLALFGEEKRDFACPSISSTISYLAKENTGHSCLGQEQVVAVTRGRGCATLGAKRSAAGSAAGHPGARRPRVCAAAAVCMLEAGRRWPCIFDPSHTYI